MKKATFIILFPSNATVTGAVVNHINKIASDCYCNITPIDISKNSFDVSGSLMSLVAFSNLTGHEGYRLVCKDVF